MLFIGIIRIFGYSVYAMKKVFIILLAICASLASQAQTKGSGDIPEDVYYLMPSFTQGTIFMRGQIPAQGTLNICAVDNTLRFIDKNGQELSATNVDNILKVRIDTVTFMRHEGVFYRMYPVMDDMGAAVRRNVRIIRDAKESAYGGTSQTSAIQSYGTMHVDGVAYDLKSNKRYPWESSEEFYVYKGETLQPLSKRALRKLFPAKKAEIDAWFKAGNTLPEDLGGVIALLKSWAE